MSEQKIILIGGGGHCKACIDVVESGTRQVAGVIDPAAGGEVLGYPVLGGDDVLPQYAGTHAFLITIGQIKSAGIRTRIHAQLKSLGASLATVVAGTATVSRHATIGEGTVVMHHAVVNAMAQIGDNCILNTRSLVEHDVVIGDHTHVSTGALLNGGCRIGSGCFIGSGAVVSQGVVIADNVVVGAGSLVIRNIEEPGVYAGNPAKKIS